MKKIKKAKVFFGVCNKGTDRWIYQDKYGFIVKHSGSLTSVEERKDGSFRAIGTPYEIYKKRMNIT
jgi:hypothetical protein